MGNPDLLAFEPDGQSPVYWQEYDGHHYVSLNSPPALGKFLTVTLSPTAPSPVRSMDTFLDDGRRISLNDLRLDMQTEIDESLFQVCLFLLSSRRSENKLLVQLRRR